MFLLIRILYIYRYIINVCNTGSIASSDDPGFGDDDFMTFFVFNTPFENSSHVIFAETDDDVIESVVFFKTWKSSLEFRIRSGSNSLGGWSKCEGCATLDLNLMKNIEQITDEDGDPYLTVQPGVNISQFVSWLNSDENIDKLLVPHGDCPMV